MRDEKTVLCLFFFTTDLFCLGGCASFSSRSLLCCVSIEVVDSAVLALPLLSLSADCSM